MSLIKKYTDGLSVIETYDDYKLKENELEELLKDIYDLCNEIAFEEKFNEEQIKRHFYCNEKLEKLNK